MVRSGSVLMVLCNDVIGNRNKMFVEYVGYFSGVEYLVSTLVTEFNRLSCFALVGKILDTNQRQTLVYWISNSDAILIKHRYSSLSITTTPGPLSG